MKLFFLFCVLLNAVYGAYNFNNSSSTEQTLIMVKPDGVQRGLIGEVIKRFEQKGLKLVAMKFIWAKKETVEKHYGHLKDRPFFNGLVEYITSAPVVPMVWQGTNAVFFGRTIIGKTDPVESPRGTIRGDFCLSYGLTVVHGSHSLDEANREVNLWFKKDEITSWNHALAEWVDD